MEDQFMALVCAGGGRKAFFEKAGFVEQHLTNEALHYMIGPARERR